MAGIAEESRRRVARALCLVGIALVLAGTALIIQDQARDSASHRAAAAEPPPDHDARLAQAVKLKDAMFWLLVLVGVFTGIFGLSTLAFLRWSRRFRRWILHEPHPPTPADDLWAMHRLPDEPPQDSEPDHGG